MSELFTTAEDLKQAFDLDAHTKYEKFNPLKKDVGFSVQRSYPQNCKYSPPVNKDGVPDTYALIFVLYEPNRLSSTNPKIIPISAKVSVLSRYISSHGDYDFKDANCPTEESIEASKKTPRPVELAADDMYAYDHEQDVFVDENGHEIPGIQIINQIYEDHLATVNKFKGLVLRFKLASRDKLGGACETIRGLLKWTLKTGCGRSLEPDDPMRGIFTYYRREDVKLLITERIEVFGYKASKNVIVTFCLFLLMGYSFLYFTNESLPWLKGIANNSLLAFAFSILCIAVLDHLPPVVLLWAINFLMKIRFWLLSQNVKF